MKRFGQSLIALAASFQIGAMPALAAEMLNTQETQNMPAMVVLAENKTAQTETQKLLIIGPTQGLPQSLLASLLSSYGYETKNLLALYGSPPDPHQNTLPSANVVPTSHQSVQLGGTNGTGNVDAGSTGSSGTGVNPSPKTLQIIEMYPNTLGDDKTDEYIKLKNVGQQPMPVNGWMLKDASGKTFTLTDTAPLAAGGTMTISRVVSNIALNNEVDNLALIAPDQTTVDTVSYTQAPKGQIYQRTANGWQWPQAESSTSSTVATQATVPSTQTPQPTVAAHPSPTQTAGSKTLQLVSVYPSTTEGDEEAEYVAIKNTGTEAVTLNGWILKDASDKSFTFDQTELIGPGETKKFSRAQTKLTLNNDVDELLLLAPDKQLIDKLAYENAPKGETYQRIDNVWYWSASLPTAQSETLPKPAVQTDTSAAAPKSVMTPAKQTIKDALKKQDGVPVEVMGTVNVLPNVLGKQFFYMQDDEAGIQVYKNDASFPELTTGQLARVVGELSTSGAERRLKVTKSGTIEPLTITQSLVPTKMPVAQIEMFKSGMLIESTGVISHIATDEFVIEADGTSLTIGIAGNTQIETAALTPGMKVHVTGIVRATSAAFKLMPRSQNDIVVEAETSASAAGTIETGKEQNTRHEQQIALALAGASAMGLAGWMIAQYVLNKRNRYAQSTCTIGVKETR